MDMGGNDLGFVKLNNVADRFLGDGSADFVLMLGRRFGGENCNQSDGRIRDPSPKGFVIPLPLVE